MQHKFATVRQGVDLLLAERGDIAAAGHQFRILHRFREPGTACAAGEEVAVVELVYRGNTILIPLSLTLRLVFDFLAHHYHFPQSAAQITAAMKADPFYQRHGANAATRVRLTRKISRSSIKVYVQRLRAALQQTFRNAHIQSDPSSVLISQETSSNEVGYQLRARFQWIHIDHPGRRLIGP